MNGAYAPSWHNIRKGAKKKKCVICFLLYPLFVLGFACILCNFDLYCCIDNWSKIVTIYLMSFVNFILFIEPQIVQINIYKILEIIALDKIHVLLLNREQPHQFTNQCFYFIIIIIIPLILK